MLFLPILLGVISEMGGGDGVVALADETLDAGREVASELLRRYGIDATLVSACVVSGAVTPSYKLWFRGVQEAVCVVRPWRVYTWMFDLEYKDSCECERP
jgi:hypothetical protein